MTLHGDDFVGGLHDELRYVGRFVGGELAQILIHQAGDHFNAGKYNAEVGAGDCEHHPMAMKDSARQSR
jgi:hypothetical protein